MVEAEEKIFKMKFLRRLESAILILTMHPLHMHRELKTSKKAENYTRKLHWNTHWYGVDLN